MITRDGRTNVIANRLRFMSTGLERYGAMQPFCVLVRVARCRHNKESLMTFHVLVAAASNEDWTAISEGIRQYRPDASILRVKDGEQAARFLFHRGLFSEEPETPDLVVLSAELSFLPADAVIAGLRQHSRTRTTPAIVIWRAEDGADGTDASERQQWLRHQSLVSIVFGTHELGQEIAEAVRLLCANST